MQRESEMNLPYIVSAMATELGLIRSLNFSGIRSGIEVNYEVRKQTYTDHLGKILDNILVVRYVDLIYMLQQIAPDVERIYNSRIELLDMMNQVPYGRKLMEEKFVPQTVKIH